MIHATTWINLKGIMLSEKKRTIPKSTVDPIYMTFLKWQNYGGGEQISGSKTRSTDAPIRFLLGLN